MTEPTDQEFHNGEPHSSKIMACIGEVAFGTGNRIEFSPGVTVLLGPNNVGKSRLLHDLSVSTDIDTSQHPEPIWESISVSKCGSAEAAIEWCVANSVFDTKVRAGARYFEYASASGRAALAESQLSMWWPQPTPMGLGPFMLYLAADDRAALTKAVTSFAVNREYPRFALQEIWRDPNKSNALGELTEQAFGVPISVHLHGGSEISLHFGKPSASPYDETQRVAYLEEMSAIPEVHAQGHGLRAFVGLLMEIIAGNHLILLIDEPEAFLHPPKRAYLAEHWLKCDSETFKLSSRRTARIWSTV